MSWKMTKYLLATVVVGDLELSVVVSACYTLVLASVCWVVGFVFSIHIFMLLLLTYFRQRSMFLYQKEMFTRRKS
jgi:hypothetical protein